MDRNYDHLRKWFEPLYWTVEDVTSQYERLHTMKRTAEHFGVPKNILLIYMKAHNIKRHKRGCIAGTQRPNTRKFRPPNVDEIRRLYWDEELSQAQIGKRYGNVTRECVSIYMKKNNIPRRPERGRRKKD